MSTWNETYPRPQLKRGGNYQILNDGWTLNGSAINLPFPPEAKLSGFNGELSEVFCYKREFAIPEAAATCVKTGGHLLLYVGACDQVCTVFADDDQVGHSELGYFTVICDITETTRRSLESGKRSVTLRIEGEDHLDHVKPYGKQRKDRGGMWYTPVSGIWQTVWCEWVSDAYISRFTYTVAVNPQGEVTVGFDVTASGAPVIPENAVLADSFKDPTESIHAIISLPEGDYDLAFNGTHAELNMSALMVNGQQHGIQWWSPENPYLYRIMLQMGNDTVLSYFAVRTVSIEQQEITNRTPAVSGTAGFKRICINGKPVFLNGVLDQGYFQDGIFTPESPDEYTRDIHRMKELGFNMLRKHIKVEPDIFYYECDRLGMFVLQDMVNNGEYSFWRDTALATLGMKLNDKGRYPDVLKEMYFRESAYHTQDKLANNPCVIGYTVFNEGWGQTDSDDIGDNLKARDPSRFYDYTSGWFAQKHSDVESVHIYFRNKKLKALGLPLLLSEFGGFTREVQGHIWNSDKSYGYGKCKDEKTLTDRIIATYRKMVLSAIPRGLCGAVYTQLSDIEDEINGFYTYDRAVCKVDAERIRKCMEDVMNVFKEEST